MTDVTVYVTHHYNSVFYVEPTCGDWTLQRVRVRAVAWAFLGDPDKGANGRGNHGGNRLANYSRSDIGEVMLPDGRLGEVYLQPGEMVLYEGAWLRHGRPMRFKVRRQTSAFVSSCGRSHSARGLDDFTTPKTSLTRSIALPSIITPTRS